VWQKWLVTQHSMLIWELFYFMKVWDQKSSLILAYHKLLGDVVTVTVKRRTLHVRLWLFMVRFAALFMLAIQYMHVLIK